MKYFAFRLDWVFAKNPRGKVLDNDVVTFNTLVNQIDRGHGAGLFVLQGTGKLPGTPASAVIPNVKNGMSNDWIIGPVEISSGDSIQIAYSGTNISDSDLDLSGQAEIELKILNAIVVAAAGAVGGAVGAAIGAVLNTLGDPVGMLLGYKPQGPCNGPVFSDSVEFNGAGLDGLIFQKPTIHNSFTSLPRALEVSFTRSYTDELTHNEKVCGAVAHTDITFSVLQVPDISLKYYMHRVFPSLKKNGLADGIRRLAPAGGNISIRSLLGLRP